MVDYLQKGQKINGTNGPSHEKICLGGGGGLRTTKAQSSIRSLISAFVVPLFERIISKLATSKISLF